MADRDAIAKAMMDQWRLQEFQREREALLLQDQEYQRYLGPKGRPDPNAMPFVKSVAEGGFPAQAYQWALESGFPKHAAAEATVEELRNPPQPIQPWADSALMGEY